MAKFKITGDVITEKTRELWVQGDYKQALKYISETIPEMNRVQQFDLIEYRMKLVGVNDLDFVKETETRPNDYPLVDDVLGFVEHSRTALEDRISSDRLVAEGIIEFFPSLYRGERGVGSKDAQEDGYQAAKTWLGLLPEVRYEFNDRMHFYHSMWLREVMIRENPNYKSILGEANKYVMEKTIGGFGLFQPKSVISATLGDNDQMFLTKKGREDYDRICDQLFIFGETRDDIYESIKNLWLRYRPEFIPMSKEEWFSNNPVKEKEDPSQDANKDNSMKEQFGWIAPNGNYYPCGWGGHGVKSANILKEEFRVDTSSLIVGKDLNSEFKNSENTLERRGWLKITKPDNSDEIVFLIPYTKATKMQLKRISHYCKTHKVAYPFNLEM